MNRKNYELFNRETQALIYGNQEKAIQRMLDFDYVCNRKTPSVKAIVNPTGGGPQKFFYGDKEILIPMYRSIKKALAFHHNIDVMVNFASFRSAFISTKQAIFHKKIKTIVIIAEGIPERRTRELIALSKKHKKWIIGPATVGGVVAGQFKIGNTGGTIENMIASKLHRSGSVGFVSKSGGLSNEMYNVIGRNSNGIYEGIAIGGDAFPGTRLVDHLIRMEKNPKIKMQVVLGEIGGTDELEIAKAIKDKIIKKPLIAWVTGTCAKQFSTEVQFGHAGAKSGVDIESADAKNKALKQAGAIVPNSFNDIGKKIKQTYQKLVKAKIIQEVRENKPAAIPNDYETQLKEKKIRKPTQVVCSISCDTGDEATYLGEPISKVTNKESLGLGYVIGLLWFKKKLPLFACNYIEMILKTVADHGPCVSGAMNTIVSARAGKDLISSLASGLLTIGPRFGGAIDGAAKHFKQAYDRKLTAQEFVKEMKAKGVNIPGIGHKVKSIKNPDKRVEILKKYAKKHFKINDYLDYALAVEQITIEKKENLILNVDGCIATTFIDMMMSLPNIFSKKEIDKLIELGFLNGLFVLGRSVGLMGHYFDQLRYKQRLYRFPTQDVLYLTKGKSNE
ncbi:MAG: ATP citrate synthase [Candidatus Moranbacteria bacterium]|nr:ATP citrate synthase [Candidatus Moranbacteria bacterium]